MPKKERAAKAAAFAIAQELDSEMTEEEMARMEKSGMGVGKAGLNTGEEKLFGACVASHVARSERGASRTARACALCLRVRVCPPPGLTRAPPHPAPPRPLPVHFPLPAHQ